jgi:zinc transport system substrate-binding protein
MKKSGLLGTEMKVAATIFPLYDMVRTIGGEEIEVVLMLPAGASPHTFDPQPRLVRNLEGTQQVFAIGNGLDNWATDLAESTGAELVIVDRGVDLKETEGHGDHGHDDEHGHDDHEEEYDDHNHGPIDPHYWLSPVEAQKVVTTIADELSELDPENAELYEQRADDYTAELQALNVELSEQLASLTNRNILSLHNAWYYFADAFSLNLVGTFEPAAGKEPSPRYIEELQELVQEQGVDTIFLEPQLSQAAITAFAQDNNLDIAVIDPLGGVNGRDSYLELMRFNANEIVTALAE